jgi:hypothetical protein
LLYSPENVLEQPRFGSVHGVDVDSFCIKYCHQSATGGDIRTIGETSIFCA